jgi:hypothetical protein
VGGVIIPGVDPNLSISDKQPMLFVSDIIVIPYPTDIYDSVTATFNDLIICFGTKINKKENNLNINIFKPRYNVNELSPTIRHADESKPRADIGGRRPFFSTFERE